MEIKKKFYVSKKMFTLILKQLKTNIHLNKGMT